MFALDSDQNLLRRIRRLGARARTIPAPYRIEAAVRLLEDAVRHVPAPSGPPWAVMDGYRFKHADYSRIRKLGARVLAVDDTARLRNYPADIVLNQNLGAEELALNALPKGKRLAGTRYTLLRPEFRCILKSSRTFPARARKVLVTFGATDPLNATLKAVGCIRRSGINDLSVTVVVGPHYRHMSELKRSLPKGYKLVVNPSDMARLMARADVAVTAGGTTLWEMAALGTPALIGSIAPNQESAVQRAVKAGIALGVGSWEKADLQSVVSKLKKLLQSAQLRRKLSSRGRRHFDGDGVIRVVDAMLGRNLIPIRQSRPI